MIQPNDHSEGNNENDGFSAILNFPASLSFQMNESIRLIEEAEREMTNRAAQERDAEISSEREKNVIAEKNSKKRLQCEKCKFHNENRYITCAVNPLFMQDAEEEFCRDYEEEIIIEEAEQQQDLEPNNSPPDVTDLNPDHIGGVSFSIAADALIRVLTAGRFS